MTKSLAIFTVNDDTCYDRIDHIDPLSVIKLEIKGNLSYCIYYSNLNKFTNITELILELACADVTNCSKLNHIIVGELSSYHSNIHQFNGLNYKYSDIVLTIGKIRELNIQSYFVIRGSSRYEHPTITLFSPEKYTSLSKYPDINNDDDGDLEWLLTNMVYDFTIDYRAGVSRLYFTNEDDRCLAVMYFAGKTKIDEDGREYVAYSF